MLAAGGVEDSLMSRPAPDLVNRDFTARGPDQVWAADITQFRIHEGWLHLAAVITATRW
jgi:putative transposase